MLEEEGVSVNGIWREPKRLRRIPALPFGELVVALVA